ncbi:hypothetical protein CUS72_13240 [Enterococcus faecium]|nr:hypothetical protein CUS72_13240 [Enterococcus faecium]
MFEYAIKKIYSFFNSEKKSFFHFITPLFVIYGIWFSWILIVFNQCYFRPRIDHWQFALFQCLSLFLVLFSILVLTLTNIDKLNFKSFLWKLFLIFLTFRFVDLSIIFLTPGIEIFEGKSIQQFILICNFFIFLIVQKIACKYIIRQFFYNRKGGS